MSTKNQIKWRDSDSRQLSRTVKNFNAKIARQIKKGVQPDMLPERITKRELLSAIRTREDLKRQVNKYDRFSQRGNEQIRVTEQGVPVTKWQEKELNREIGIINAKRTVERNRIADLPALHGGKRLGKSRGEMGDTRSGALRKKKINIDKVRKGKEWDKMIKAIESELNRQNEPLYKENYLKALDATYGDATDPEIKEAYQILRDKILSMSNEEVVDTYYRDEAAEIKFIYPNDITSTEENLFLLYQVWGLEWNDEIFVDDTSNFDWLDTAGLIDDL